jgi:3-hydroxyisobutyrate dehydrogenase
VIERCSSPPREAAVVERNMTVAFVGLGAMGSGMAACLLRAGLPLVVHNRTVRPFAGARVADSAADAVAGADIVFVSLSDDDAVESVLFGDAAGALRPGTVVVNTSAVSPAYARSSAERLRAAGVVPVEAGVVGNPDMARAGKLRVLTGGRAEDAAAVSDVLELVGEQVVHVGDHGSAAVLKLCFNLLLGAQTAALAEAVSYGASAGIDRDVLLDSLVHSGFASPVLSFRAAFMRSGQYEPAAFRAGLMAKDLGNVLSDAAELGLGLPVVARLAERFTQLAGVEPDSDAAAILRLQQVDAGRPQGTAAAR